MVAWQLNENERVILLDALVSYADGCILPSLTPSCPYYRRSATGPTCGMECRQLIDKAGGRHSEVKDYTVGGLVMTGLALPQSAAGSGDEYDARRLFLTQRMLPLREQSTGALLLGLEVALRKPAFAERSPTRRALDVWGELSQRGLDVDRVVRGALLPVMTSAVGFHAAWPDFLAVAGEGRLPDGLPVSASVPAVAGWREVLLAVQATLAPDAPELRPYRGLRTAAADQTAVPPWEDDEWAGDLSRSLLERDTVRLAMSHLFLGRVEDWLARLQDEDMEAFLDSSPPPPSVLLAMTPVPLPTRDEVGLWVYERLTVTNLEEWSDSSLMLEWRAGQGESLGCCPERLLRERTIDQDLVANLALARVSRRRGRRLRAPGLNAQEFVKNAVLLLRQNRASEAADLFAGIVELRPADGEALNNYGFCLLPIDAERALTALQGAALYDRQQPRVNLANRALALHLLGRNLEAEVLAREVVDTGAATDEPTAFLWLHESGGGDQLRLADSLTPRAYCGSLLEHLAVAQTC